MEDNYLFKISLEDLKKSRKKGVKSILSEYYDKFIVYKWIVNNKPYIGLTTNLKVRIKNYLANISDSYINRALLKYDDSEIYFVILEICKTKEDMIDKEIYYINLYDSIKSGYNLTTGGENFKASQETIKKMRDSAKNKKKLYLYSVESNEIELEFESISSAARFLNINKSNIFSSISKKFLLLGKYKPSHTKENEWFEEDDNHKNSLVMKGNTNADKYLWTLEYEDGVIFKETSLRKLKQHCPDVKDSTFRRIAENKMKDLSKYNFRIYREKLIKNEGK